MPSKFNRVRNAPEDKATRWQGENLQYPNVAQDQ